MKARFILLLVLLITFVLCPLAFAPTIDSYPNTGTLSSGDYFLIEAANRTTYRNITWGQFQTLISATTGSGTFVTILATTNINTYSFITNLFATTINAVTNISNYDFTTNLFVTNITAQTINAVTNINNYDYSTNITAVTINATTNINTYSFITNLYVTNLYAQTINAVTNISDFFFTTNLFVTNLFTTVIDATTNINNYAFITNLFSTNIYTTNLFATTINATTNINNFTFTTNLYTTNLFATTVNAVTNISNFSYLTNLYVTNLTVQNFNLTTNGFVLSYGGIGTNETWVGPTTFVDTNKSGVIDILDGDGTTIIAGYDTNFNGFFGRGYAVSTNSWSGATNAIDLTHSDTYYVSYIPVSLTGVSGKLGAYSSGVSLSISNAASTNITIDFTSFKTSDGTRSSIITNATIGEFWIKFSPVWGTTQLVARPSFY